jgi:septal ring factor EnvC (AmiA/AmiB activator)
MRAMPESGNRIRSVACALGLVIGLASPATAQDRADELEGLRGKILESRERVTAHEADERAILEQLEEVDRRLQTATRERNAARREIRAAKAREQEIEPRLEKAQRTLAATQKALAARATALYRGGEVGPVRVLFSATSLPDLLSRASALRVLVRHDAELVSRFGEERDRLSRLRVEAAAIVKEREQADIALSRVASELAMERKGKRTILGSVRENRTSERRLLLELEQAATALEETIRTLGERAADSSSGVADSGFAGRKGTLRPPVIAAVSARFGRVLDPEFQTETLRNGVDFAAEAGARVGSVAVGVTRFAGWFRGYGRIVIIDHGDGFHTVSGHLDEIHVEVGDPVEAGQSLGTVGETGSLGGPSLYFELRRGGDPIDPVPWLADTAN